VPTRKPPASARGDFSEGARDDCVASELARVQRWAARTAAARAASSQRARWRRRQAIVVARAMPTIGAPHRSAACEGPAVARTPQPPREPAGGGAHTFIVSHVPPFAALAVAALADDVLVIVLARVFARREEAGASNEPVP
jgi:hypothetical protein